MVLHPKVGPKSQGSDQNPKVEVCPQMGLNLGIVITVRSNFSLFYPAKAEKFFEVK